MQQQDRLLKIKEAMLFRNGIALKPSRGMFYLTSLCNLHCKMCFQESHQRDLNELSLEEIKEIFQNIQLSSIHLVGGEIFARCDIYDILSFFNSNYKNISIQTNATLINDYGINELKQMHNINDIWISIDGLSHIHNAIRGKDVFEHAVKVINALNGYKRIFINTVILDDNINSLQKIYDYFNDLNVYKVTFQFEMGYSSHQRTKAEYELRRNHLSAVINTQNEYHPFLYAEPLVQIIPELLKNEKKTIIAFYPKIFVDKVDNYIQGNIRDEYKVVCNDFIEPILKINAKGDVVLCEAFDLSIGNLKKDQLNDIWNNDQAKKIRQSLSLANLTDMCSRCCCLSNRKVELSND